MVETSVIVEPCTSFRRHGAVPLNQRRPVTIWALDVFRVVTAWGKLKRASNNCAACLVTAKHQKSSRDATMSARTTTLLITVLFCDNVWVKIPKRHRMRRRFVQLVKNFTSSSLGIRSDKHDRSAQPSSAPWPDNRTRYHVPTVTPPSGTCIRASNESNPAPKD